MQALQIHSMIGAIDCAAGIRPATLSGLRPGCRHKIGRSKAESQDAQSAWFHSSGRCHHGVRAEGWLRAKIKPGRQMGSILS
jgi:hypothetical protein